MSITTSQIFQIGGVVISAVVGAGAILSAAGFSPTAVTLVTGLAALVGGVWGSVGAILTGQASQIHDVVSRASEPVTQTALVRAVAGMKGVDIVQTNENALPALKVVAASSAPEDAKVLEPSK